jgi:hypothetical protein
LSTAFQTRDARHEEKTKADGSATDKSKRGPLLLVDHVAPPKKDEVKEAVTKFFEIKKNMNINAPPFGAPSTAPSS